jgi:nucleotide-binding universal stress UspA family protein
VENKIITPLDGTESVEEILLYATSITPRVDTVITWLHVFPVGNTEPADEVNARIQDIHDALSQSGWTVTREMRMGNAIEEIVKFSLLNTATMLLMSTHGRTRLERRIRKGSVTEQVLRQSPCPDEMETAEPESDRPAIKAALKEHSLRLANAGLKVSLDMPTYKRPIREILNKIDELSIDLVFMISHGKSGTPRALDESVTAEVIRHANCPLPVWSAEPQCPPVRKG